MCVSVGRDSDKGDGIMLSDVVDALVYEGVGGRRGGWTDFL